MAAPPALPMILIIASEGPRAERTEYFRLFQRAIFRSPKSPAKRICISPYLNKRGGNPLVSYFQTAIYFLDNEKSFNGPTQGHSPGAYLVIFVCSKCLNSL